MKLLICALLFICTFSAAVRLRDDLVIAIESGFLDNFYMAVEGSNCQNMTEGKCGRIYGLGIPSSTNVSELKLLRLRQNVQWNLYKQDDYFCLNSILFNGFLSIDGQSCLNRTSDVQCGNLFITKLRDMKCSSLYGWRITFINNHYVLQSVQFPNVYIYFNSENCTGLSNIATIQQCGNFMGHYIQNISSLQNINSSSLFRWIFFNVHPLGMRSFFHIARP
jgi:hypothetical protein